MLVDIDLIHRLLNALYGARIGQAQWDEFIMPYEEVLALQTKIRTDNKVFLQPDLPLSLSVTFFEKMLSSVFVAFRQSWQPLSLKAAYEAFMDTEFARICQAIVYQSRHLLADYTNDCLQSLTLSPQSSLRQALTPENLARRGWMLNFGCIHLERLSWEFLYENNPLNEDGFHNCRQQLSSSIESPRLVAKVDQLPVTEYMADFMRTQPQLPQKEVDDLILSQFQGTFDEIEVDFCYEAQNPLPRSLHTMAKTGELPLYPVLTLAHVDRFNIWSRNTVANEKIMSLKQQIIYNRMQVKNDPYAKSKMITYAWLAWNTALKSCTSTALAEYAASHFTWFKMNYRLLQNKIKTIEYGHIELLAAILQVLLVNTGGTKTDSMKILLAKALEIIHQPTANITQNQLNNAVKLWVLEVFSPSADSLKEGVRQLPSLFKELSQEQIECFLKQLMFDDENFGSQMVKPLDTAHKLSRVVPLQAPIREAVTPIKNLHLDTAVTAAVTFADDASSVTGFMSPGH